MVFDSSFQEGNSPPILVNFFAGKDDDFGFAKAIFRDSLPVYGIVKLYILLLTLASPSLPLGDIITTLAVEGVLELYVVIPVTFTIFFSSVPSHLIDTNPFLELYR